MPSAGTLSQVGSTQQSLSQTLTQAFSGGGASSATPVNKQAFTDGLTSLGKGVSQYSSLQSGLGSVGPASNYAVLTDFQLWVCTLGMLLGRLEILSFMALLTPAFWRR